MIAIKDLSFQYPNSPHPALENINLTIEKGSVFGLIGPNGAGKTTLISLLTGILQCNANTICINGHPLPSAIAKAKAISGYVPQDYAYYPNLTASENLAFFAGIQKIPSPQKKQRIDYCIEFCRLEKIAHQRASGFSGGLKRRLNIAIGLLTNPAILYFDEPTVGIDPQSRAFILARIKELRNQGKTIIYTSHYMEEVEQLCDHLAIIDHGNLLTHGTLDSLKKELDYHLVIEYCSILSEAVADTLQNQYTVAVTKQRLTFGEVNNMTQLRSIIDHLITLDINVLQVNYSKNNLEQLFLQLTNRDLRD